MTIMYCRNCDVTFDKDRASEVTELMDDMYDRGFVQVTELLCPLCGSSDICEEWEAENEGRLMDRAFGPDRED